MAYSKSTLKYREKLTRSIKSDIAKMNTSARAIGISHDSYLKANIRTINTLTSTKDMKMFHTGNLSRMSTQKLERIKQVTSGYLKNPMSTVSGRKKNFEKIYDSLSAHGYHFDSKEQASRTLKKLGKVQDSTVFQRLKSNFWLSSEQVLDALKENKDVDPDTFVNALDITEEIMTDDGIASGKTGALLRDVISELQSSGTVSDEAREALKTKYTEEVWIDNM